MENLQVQTRALSSLIKEINKGKYDFNHPLQRQSGQWNKIMMSELIDSAIRLYPIYPVLIEKYNDSKTFGVIDGKQRLTILTAFANNEFSLSKHLSPVIINGESYELAGKKYNTLDAVVRERFESREFQLYIMENATDFDVREIFARINSSKGLSNTQKRTTIESEELAQVVAELKSHPFFDKVLSATQKRKDVDKDMVREILMLAEDNSGKYALNSFKTKDIDAFIEFYNSQIDAYKIGKIKDALDKLDSEFETLQINMLTIPFAVNGMVRSMENGKEKLYIDWLLDFVNTYEQNEEYRSYCQSGSASKEMVQNRKIYFENVLNNL